LPDLDDLSDDAKTVGGCFFPTASSSVTFHMQTSGPSKRTQAGLDELLRAGWIEKEVLDAETGAHRYTCTTSLHELQAWNMSRLLSGEMANSSFALYEPLSQSAEDPANGI
jgi:hypothetical protein